MVGSVAYCGAIIRYTSDNKGCALIEECGAGLSDVSCLGVYGIRVVS